MFIRIDFMSTKPIYQQIRDQVVEAIASGKLATGVSLPSTRQLAADFGIHFHTVNKAYDMLRDEGYVRISRQKTATVARPDATGEFLADWEGRARTLLAELMARGETDEAIRACVGRALFSLRAGTSADFS